MIATAISVLSLFGPQAPMPQPDAPPRILLVTSEALAPAWQEFADWKTRLGKPCTILTVESIDDDEQPGVDTQDRLRRAIVAAIENDGVRWVILGGDSEPTGGPVPHRVTPHKVPLREDLPTDLYYLSTTDWDADGDGIYGEWPDDRDAITYGHASASIARIPVRSAEHVAAYTKKVIAYESQYPTDGFAQRMLYTNTVPHSEAKVRKSWDRFVSKAWEGGSLLRWFQRESPVQTKDGRDVPLIPNAFVAMMNQGIAGKIHMHGHGHLPAWVLDHHRTLEKKHVDALENRYALPVITTVSCNTGEFDSAQDPSIAESMLRHAGGGAIAILAPSRPGVPVFSDPNDFQLMVEDGKLDGTTETMTRFWTHGLSEGLTLGESFARVKADFVDRANEHPGYHWCQCELNLLGDPTLGFRATPPTQAELLAPTSIAIGAQTIEVRATPGALLCAWKGAEVYTLIEVPESGTALLKVTPKTAGTLKLTVSGDSLNAAVHDVRVE